MKEGEKYIDDLDRIWVIKMREEIINYTRGYEKILYPWNKECGWGVWDNGKGLKLLTPN